MLADLINHPMPNGLQKKPAGEKLNTWCEVHQNMSNYCVLGSAGEERLEEF